MQEDFKSLKPEQLEALKQLLGEAYNVQLPDASDWFDGKQIDEIAFGEYLLRKKERKCIHGKLYDLDGEISDEVIRKEILDEIRPYQKTNVAKEFSFSYLWGSLKRDFPCRMNWMKYCR